MKPLRATKEDDADIRAGKVQCSGHEVSAEIYLLVEGSEELARKYMANILAFLNREMRKDFKKIMKTNGAVGFDFNYDSKGKFKVLKF